MSDKQLDRDADSVRRENARVGYQAAAELWGLLAQETWDRFNVMVFSNSIVIGILGLAIANRLPLKDFVLLLSVAGLFLCAFWTLIMRRGFEYAKYLVWSASELEEHYLGDAVRTLSRGRDFADGKWIQLEIGGKVERLIMSRWTRKLKAEILSYMIVLVFVIIYLAIIFLAGKVLS